jgi:hypothetical protein
MKILRMILMAAVSALLMACGSDSDPTEPETAPDQEQTMDDPTPQALDLNQSIAAARSDLAGRLNRAPERIEIVEARSVTWPNGALGCPEPDMMYTQALVPGFYIRLQAGDQTYAYHAGRDGQPFACPDERSQRPPMSANEPAAY